MPSKAAQRAIEQREANAELQRSSSTDYVTLTECKKIARQKVDETKSKSSKLFSNIDASLGVIPQFSINELTLGKVLQRGKCSVVKRFVVCIAIKAVMIMRSLRMMSNHLMIAKRQHRMNQRRVI
jgi:hypothetical protein